MKRFVFFIVPNVGPNIVPWGHFANAKIGFKKDLPAMGKRVEIEYRIFY